MFRHTRATSAVITGLSVAVLAGCAATSGTPTTGSGAEPATATETVTTAATVTETVTTTAPPSHALPSGPASTVTQTVTTTVPPTASGTPWCSDPDVAFTNADGAAGSVYRTMTLTNTSSAACDVGGYPYTYYVTSQGGSQVGSAATPDGPPVGIVTLQPGGATTTVLQSANDPAGVFGTGACSPVSVSGVEVYVPGNSQSTYVPLPAGSSQQGCQTDPQGQSILSITAIGS